MSAAVGRPAPRPCGSCPYRRDVPSGVWDRDEYEKLPEFDVPLGQQPPSVFLCHQQEERLCAGWVAVHDMHESLGLRIATSMGTIADEDVPEIVDYTTDVPLFASGAEAAAHGLRDVDAPGGDARATIKKLYAKRAR